MSAKKQYQPKTKEELKQAIQEYQQGKHKERGEPNDWDVSLITDMRLLFKLGGRVFRLGNSRTPKTKRIQTLEETHFNSFFVTISK
jgi:hypothetical protein